MARIIIVGHLPDFPGPYSASRRVESIARGLALRGHAVLVDIPLKVAPRPVPASCPEGVTVRWNHVGGSRSRVLDLVMARGKAVRHIAEIARRREMDWLLLYNLGLEGLPMAVVARRFQVNVATVYGDVRYHPSVKTMDDRVRLAWLELADRLLPRFGDLNVSDTTFLEARLRRIAPRVPTFVLPPLVDRDVFRYDAEAARAFRVRWALGEANTIGYTGSFTINNGVANLLLATRILVDRGHHLRVLVAGRPVRGMDCDDVAAQTKALGLTDTVVLPGYLDTAQVVAAMSACDILTVPRIPHVINEAGSPTKLAEYLAIGKPVVAAATGDVGSYIRDGIDGVLVEPGNVAALVSALALLLDNSSLRAAIGNAALQTAAEVFDFRRGAERLENAMLGAR